MPAKVQTEGLIDEQESLRTVREACEALRIGPTKTWELISNGTLEVVRLGRRSTRIKKSSIDRLVHAGVTQEA